jgi:hypothetical protein
MARLRFETVRDVIEAFPIAEHELDLEPSDERSLDFLSARTSGDDALQHDKGIGFCAFLLPRREAVWWGCRAVRRFVPKGTLDEEEGFRVAEQWVNDPDEDRRMTALELGLRYSSKLPTTHLALAAGWSGRTFAIGGGDPLPIQPHQTARAVRAAILIAACRASMAERPEVMRSCLEEGAKIASDETFRL